MDVQGRRGPGLWLCGWLLWGVVLGGWGTAWAGPSRGAAQSRYFGTKGLVGMPMLRWRHRAQLKVQTAIASEGSRLYVQPHKAIEALDRKSGRVLWRFGLKRSAVFAVAARGGRLFFANGAKELVALDGAKAKVLWRKPLARPASTPVIAPGDGRLYTAHRQGRLRAWSAKDGKPLWSYQAQAGIQTPPVKLRGRLFALTHRGHLLALDAGSGRLLWQHRKSYRFPPRRLMAGAGLLFVQSGASTVAYDPKTGSLRWKQRVGFFCGVRRAALHKLYISNCGKKLYGLRPKDGSVAWLHRFESGSPKSLALAGRRLYVSHQKRLYAFVAATGARLWSRKLSAQGHGLHVDASGGLSLLTHHKGYSLYQSFEGRSFSQAAQESLQLPTRRLRVGYLLVHILPLGDDAYPFYLAWLSKALHLAQKRLALRQLRWYPRRAEAIVDGLLAWLQKAPAALRPALASSLQSLGLTRRQFGQLLGQMKGLPRAYRRQLYGLFRRTERALPAIQKALLGPQAGRGVALEVCQVLGEALAGALPGLVENLKQASWQAAALQAIAVQGPVAIAARPAVASLLHTASTPALKALAQKALAALSGTKKTPLLPGGLRLMAPQQPPQGLHWPATGPLYFGLKDRQLSAYRKKDHKRLWSRLQPGSSPKPLGTLEGHCPVVTQGRLLLLDAATGATRHALSIAPRSTPKLLAPFVFFRRKKSLHFFHASGRQKLRSWPLWGRRFFATPKALLAHDSHKLRAYHPGATTHAWEIPQSQCFDFTAHGSELFCAGFDRKLYIYALATGKTVRILTLPPGIRTSILAVGPERVYLEKGKLLYAIDHRKGRVDWRRKLSVHSPHFRRQGGLLYILDGAHLRAFEARNGRQRWSWAVSGLRGFLPATRGLVFVRGSSEDRRVLVQVQSLAQTLKQLAHPGDGTRLRALGRLAGLGSLGIARAALPLLASQHRRKHPKVRQLALELAMDTALWWPMLEDALKSGLRDPSQKLRRRVFQWLLHHRSPGASAFVAGLLRHPSPALRSTGLVLALRRRNPRQADAAVALALKDPSPWVRLLAFEALGSRPGRHAAIVRGSKALLTSASKAWLVPLLQLLAGLPPAKLKPLLPATLALFAKASQVVKISIVHLWAAMGPEAKATEEILLTAFAQSRQPWFQAHILGGLAKLRTGSAAYARLLKQLHSHKDPRLRKIAQRLSKAIRGGQKP